MRWVEAVVLFSLVTLGLGTSAGAQRRPLLGTFVDAKGQPLADATVYGSYMPNGLAAHGAADAAVTDFVEAKTDARGRFRLSVYPCTPYQLWACHTKPDGDGGELVATSPLVVAAAGELATLGIARPPTDAAIIRRSKPRRIRIVGVDKWQDVAPLTLRIGLLRLEKQAGGQHRAVGIAIGADGIAVLPPLPDSITKCGIFAASGNLIRCASIPRRRTNAGDTGSSQVDEVRLYGPRTVPMIVTDASGAPVQGATIRQRLRVSGRGARSSLGHPRGVNERPYAWRALGTTDAEGRLKAIISTFQDPFQNKEWQQLFFVAEKSGLCSSHSGFSQSPFFDGKAVDRKGCSEIRFTLRPQKPLVGQLKNRGGEPLANQPFAIDFGVPIQIKNGVLGESRRVAAVTDENGRFAIADAPLEFSRCRIELAGTLLGERIMPAKLLRHTPPHFVALHRLSKRPTNDLNIDLGSMPTLQLQLLDADGGPTAGASVRLISFASNDIDFTVVPCVATNSSGRLAMVVEPGQWLLLAYKDGAWAHATLDIENSQQMDLRLEPMASVRGRVVDGNGKPIAGARLAERGIKFQGGGIINTKLQRITTDFNSRLMASTQSKADGTFVCYYLPDELASYECVFVQPIGAGKRKSSAMFALDPDGEPQTIVIK
ncbi:MAG: hypothetical protein AB8H80_23440 [Planctomycetota bacterium]